MKSIFRGLIIAFIVVSTTQAQKSPIKFGVIPPEDLNMTIYDKDSSAAAVVLVDYGYARMQMYNDIKLEFIRHVRIKILKKEGFKWADAIIELYKSGNTDEVVERFKASTFNVENGKLVETPVSKDGIFKEKFNRNTIHQKFTFPNVKEGSILEYSYTLSSDFILSFPNWEFQKDIPVRYSEFWAVIPEFCIFEKYMQGYLTSEYEKKPINSVDFNAMAHHWIMRDVPAFKSEPYMTSETDYLSKIHFAISHLTFPGRPIVEIMGSWDKLADVLNGYEDFGKAISGNAFLQKDVDALTAGLPDAKAKASAIYNYVKKNIEWNGTEDYTTESLKKVVEAKKGTSGDINLMLASMLKKAGFEVDMVLLSTRDHGFVRKTSPMEKQFNYVICRVKIGDTYQLVDATEKYLPMELLPERCLNGEGLIVSKVNKGWVSLETKAKAKTILESDFALDPSGTLSGKINFTRHGYDANTNRKEYFKEGEEKYFKNLASRKVWEITSSSFENAAEIDKPAVEKHNVQISAHGSAAGSQIYLNPFMNDEIIENPFKAETREYPIDFGKPIEKTYISKITIPSGYAADEIPQTKILALPGNAAKFVFSITVNGNLISVVRTLSINKSMFLQSEYPVLREFFNQVVAKQSEQVVLKKVNN